MKYMLYYICIYVTQHLNMESRYFKERFIWTVYLVGIIYLHAAVAIEVCSKYNDQPKSSWPTYCRKYLKNQLKVSGKNFTTETATLIAVTSRIASPLNEREVEVEFEFEDRKANKKKEKDFEFDSEIDSESDYESGSKCLRSAGCKKGSKAESDQTDEGAQSSGVRLELLRTIAVLCMSAVAGLTIIALATAIFCVIKRREYRNDQEERKDPSSRHLDDQRGFESDTGSSSFGNTPINQSQNRESDELQKTSLVKYHEATPISSPRHTPAVMTTPARSEPAFNLVNETQYASIDDELVTSNSGTLNGHYYFKLDSDAINDSQSPERQSPLLPCPPNDHHLDLSTRTLLTPMGTYSCGSPISGTLSTPQYEVLDHSGSRSLKLDSVTTNDTCYDVLDRK